MAVLTKADLLSIVDTTVEDVWVPEWQTTVKVKSLTAAERDAFEASSLSGQGRNREVNLQNVRARLLVRAIVDDSGARIFGDLDAMELGQKNASALDRLFAVASRLSGLGADDVERLAKNSESDQSGDSVSG